MGAMALAFATQAGADGRPQYGDWGFDTSGVDPAIRPGQDFFRHVNGAWMDRTEIPADKSSYTAGMILRDEVERRLHELMVAAAATHESKSLQGKVGAFYASFMDESRIDRLGAKPIKPELDALRKARSRDELASEMGRTNTDFEASLFNINIDVDLKDPKHYAVYIGQGGLGLPDRDYYLKPDFAPQKSAYEHYAATLLGLAGWSHPQQAAADVLAFETRIAEASWTKVEQRDQVAEYNPMSIAELAAFAPGFAWSGFLKQAQLGELSRIVVGEKSAFPKLAAVYASTPVETIKAWQAVHIADNAAVYLSKPFAAAYFEMHNKTLSGQQVQSERWKLGVHAVSGGDFGSGDRSETFGNLGWAVGQLYTAKYFPPEAKAKIEELVGNLKATYRARIEKLDWMGPETREEALKKLDTYTIKVGYPDHPRDYSALRVREDDLIGNVKRAAVADWAFYVGRLNGPVDRLDWVMTPQTVDAYNGSLRDIVFPAAILLPPMFDPNADPAINYGGIGGVIGHELTHGFDDEGRKIDADGALRDWWTAEDAKAFEARAKQLSDQYSAFEALPGVHVNGDLTLGENIADLGGLTLALDAYRASLKGQPAPVIDGYSGDQRVFLGWAQAWRGKVRDDALRRQVVSDPHSPRKFRVNGVVRNIDAWYELFGVKPEDALYVAPEKRVHIW